MKGGTRRVSRDVRAYVSCREYVGIPQSAHPANQGGNAEMMIFVLDSNTVRDVFLRAARAPEAGKETGL